MRPITFSIGTAVVDLATRREGNAPFARARREDDCRIAWMFFADKTTGENQ